MSSSLEHKTQIHSIFEKFCLRPVKIVRGNQTIVNFETKSHVRACAETMKALKFDDDGPNIQNKNF